jgi:hypothetical protein
VHIPLIEAQYPADALTHADIPATAAYLPLGQPVQLGAPEFEYVPGAQFVQVVFVVAPTALLIVPDGHL